MNYTGKDIFVFDINFRWKLLMQKEKKKNKKQQQQPWQYLKALEDDINTNGVN